MGTDDECDMFGFRCADFPAVSRVYNTDRQGCKTGAQCALAVHTGWQREKKPAIQAGPTLKGNATRRRTSRFTAGGQPAYFMVGMTNSAPLARCGQRVVTVFSRV